MLFLISDVLSVRSQMTPSISLRIVRSIRLVMSVGPGREGDIYPESLLLSMMWMLVMLSSLRSPLVLITMILMLCMLPCLSSSAAAASTSSADYFVDEPDPEPEP